MTIGVPIVFPFPPLQSAVFLTRLNRFAATVLTGATETTIHVPTSGRMPELLIPGAEVFWSPYDDRGERRTSGKLWVVRKPNGTLVCVDSVLPNHLVWQMACSGQLTWIPAGARLNREVTFGNSRFDFADLRSGLLVEVKSVTLVDGELGLFPDTPTARGARHVGELASAARDGYECHIVFVQQRMDGNRVTANRKRDPEFADAMIQAIDSGVKIHGYRSLVSLEGIHAIESIPYGDEGQNIVSQRPS